MERTDYKKEIEKNGVIAFVPKGRSMWPFLKNKSQSVIVTKKTDELKEFDVIFYVRNGNIFVLHRIIKVLGDGKYLVSGDSQLFTEIVSDEQIFGVMQGFYKGKKYILNDDEKNVKKVKRWYKHKLIRKIRIKLFNFNETIKQKMKRVFKRGK